MGEYIKKYAKNSLIVSILLLILSFFLIFSPSNSLNFLTRILGSIVLVTGIIHIISYFSGPKENKIFSFELVEGIVCTVLGLIIIFNPGIIINFLPIAIACWIIIDGIIKLQLAFNIKSTGNNNWKLVLIFSIITILFALIVIFNPFATMINITVICGIMLLITELINIFEAITFLRFI